MRAAGRLLASHTSSRVNLKPGQRPAPLALLPPLPLYRRLLRIHRKKLAPEERIFGDTYLKAEFRRHKDIENPLHIVGFLTQWQQYGAELAKEDWRQELRRYARGEKVEGGLMGDTGEWAMDGLLEKMSDQQIGQVHELYTAIRKRGEGMTEEELKEEEVQDLEEAVEAGRKAGNG